MSAAGAPSRMCLPLRLTMGEEESLAGFLVRLGERNHGQVRSMINAARDAGAPYWTFGAMQERHVDLDGLARLSGVAADRLATAAFPQVGRRLNGFGGGKVYRRHLMTSERRVCPACLEEEGYHRRLWHLAIAASCPRHATRLISDCGACGRRLRWGDGTLNACLCGWELRRSPVVAIDPPKLRGLATVCGLLGIETQMHVEQIALPARVAELPTQDAIDLMLHLSWLKSRDESLPRRLASITDELDGVLTEGALILSNWPTAFHRLLDTHVADPSRRAGRFGLRCDLGAVASWIQSLPRASPAGRLLRGELGKWWKTRPAAPTRAPGLRSKNAGHYTLTEAAALLGIRYEAVKAFADLGAGVESAAGGSGAPLLVQRARVAAAKVMLDDLVGHREAAAILGCGRKTFAGLAACGALAKADVRGKRLPGPRKWSRTGLLRCLAGVRSVTGQVVAPEDDVLISLRDAITLLRQGGRDLAVVWDALRSGAVGPVFRIPDGQGLCGLVAYKASVLAIGRRGHG